MFIVYGLAMCSLVITSILAQMSLGAYCQTAVTCWADYQQELNSKTK